MGCHHWKALTMSCLLKALSCLLPLGQEGVGGLLVQVPRPRPLLLQLFLCGLLGPRGSVQS